MNGLRLLSLKNLGNAQMHGPLRFFFGCTFQLGLFWPPGQELRHVEVYVYVCFHDSIAIFSQEQQFPDSLFDSLSDLALAK